jgi:tetratricopeptide (TPR) repeat protein
MVRRIQNTGILVLVGLLIVLVLVTCGEVTPTAEPVSAGDHFKRGNEYIQDGELEKAVDEYKQALELEPENVDVLTNLGVVYYNLGRLDEAIAEYLKATEIAPEDADVHSNLAAAYVQTNQLDKALDEYLRAVDLDPSLPEAHFGLGVVYIQLGENDKAIQAFERFQELDTGSDQMASSQAEQYLQQLRGE